MAVVYALSEFTDEKGTDWLIKIVDGSISTGDLNYRFTLGPDGFRLSYDFDNFDRCRPILGSRVRLTLFHPDSSDAAFNTLYTNLDTAEEGTYRVEIYRDPDGDNETWWVGAILPEQTIIPDEYPNAAVQITAVDGLAMLKGIKYNNSGVAYADDDTLTNHLYKALSKVHCNNFWGSSDTFIKFFEDFIGEEYSDSIGSGQNQQLNNAKVQHKAFYNKDDNGTNQFYSAYEVLESLALSFNSGVFMAQGVFWFVPLGALQGHGSNHLDIAHFISGNGTITYNSSTNISFGVPFGSNNNDYEKLAGWERTSSPAFKQVKRTRDYQGSMPIVLDTNYTEANILAGTILDDEDVAYTAGMRFIVTGGFYYEYDGDGSSSNNDRVGRVKLNIKLKVGDAGGTVRYMKRTAGFPGTILDHAWFYDGWDETDPPDGGSYYEALYNPAAWDASDSDYCLVSSVFDKKQGGEYYVNFSFITPILPADATGLQLSATIEGADDTGASDSAVVNGANADFEILNFAAHIYDNEEPAPSDFAHITAKNPENARYFMDQGSTLLGDTISDTDLGSITIYNGSTYVNPSKWDGIFNTTDNLSLNRLGVQERLAANIDAIRVERGTLYRTGTKFIHPYSILTNVTDSSNFYQLTGLDFIAARCEYDIECMYLTRNATGITVEQDDVKGDLIGVIGGVSEPKGPGKGTIPAESQAKLASINTDDYGITGLKITNGSSGTNDIFFPTNLATNTQAVGMRSNGAFVYIANGTAGQVLAMNPAATGQGFIDAPGAGWLGSTTRIKILPRDFVANDVGRPLMIEDDDIASNEIFLHSFSTSSCFAYIPIPTGYTATHARIYGSDTSQVYKVYSGSIDSKTIVSKSAATAIGTEADITDVGSNTTNYLVIQVQSDGSTDEIHGGYITISG